MDAEWLNSVKERERL